MAKVIKAKVRNWLLNYAWLGTPEEQIREVECILAQNEWQFTEDVADKYAGAQETGGGPQEFAEGVEFALSALYECHDEPHLPTCPRKDL